MKGINLIDPIGRTTIMYGIRDSNLDRLESSSKKVGNKTRKTFYVSPDMHNEIILLSIMKEQVFVNIAVVEQGVLKLAAVSTKVKFIETKEDKIIELYYNPTSERKIFVIDLETGDEVEPELNFTSSGEVKGVINLKTSKKYITIELREDKLRSIIVAACQLILDGNILKLNINKDEAKIISMEKYLELINSGKSIEQKLLDSSVEKER